MQSADIHLRQRPSWLATLDWASTVSGFLLLVTGILMIMNGHCSQPHGLSADAPMCVGSQLSVQSWLAITGIQFSLLSTILLPRVSTMILSKCFTKAAETTGIRFDRLLNSLSTAPLSAQLRGSKKLLLLRCLVFMLAALVSVLYKFSFVTVDAQGMVAIPNGQAYYNYGSDGYPDADTSYTEIGESDIPREHNYALGDGVPTNILSANLIDFLTVNNGSVIAVSDPGKTFEHSTDLIIGPKVNATRLTNIHNGTVESCNPLLYLRSSFYVLRQLVDGFDAIKWPLVKSTPYNNGVRFDFKPWNSTTFNGGFMDITSLANGSLQAWAVGHPLPSQSQYLYDYRITVNMRYCYGYVNWTNSAVFGHFEIEDPTDIKCQALPFDVAAWNQTLWSFNAKAFMQAACAGKTDIDDSFWMFALPIIPIMTDHSSVHGKFAPPEERNTRCNNVAQDSFAVAEGIIRASRTGMTALGIALQGLAIMAAIMAMCLIIWPRLPLLTEWPAQWLALGKGLDKTIIKEVAKDGATGSSVKSKVVVFLSSSTEERGELRLTCARP
ncbi:uncharacterized protein BKA55DRAFT_584572 [Fusarium redolens]|uniref:Uncharacterized protein n=1 Tax=Fusarium redolens TaxID=48865 RepID=A0A9P9JLJ8_FUSRE|nr:uncharacterized protein BKA55DRAFT_584572 [Fusarium redolens]KAH7224413.1 hypothetical protein BKA55DRAFT_584572 [Fusarium redolens]